MKFRIETRVDPVSQLVSASIHYPVNTKEPIAKTAAIFPSREIADKEVTTLIKQIFEKHGDVISRAVDINE